LRIVSVEFVRSAAGAGDLPEAGLPEISAVGRSNKDWKTCGDK